METFEKRSGISTHASLFLMTSDGNRQRSRSAGIKSPRQSERSKSQSQTADATEIEIASSERTANIFVD